MLCLSFYFKRGAKICYFFIYKEEILLNRLIFVAKLWYKFLKETYLSRIDVFMFEIITSERIEACFICISPMIQSKSRREKKHEKNNSTSVCVRDKQFQ